VAAQSGHIAQPRHEAIAFLFAPHAANQWKNARNGAEILFGRAGGGVAEGGSRRAFLAGPGGVKGHHRSPLPLGGRMRLLQLDESFSPDAEMMLREGLRGKNDAVMADVLTC
jgi:hypothetical protein